MARGSPWMLWTWNSHFFLEMNSIDSTRAGSSPRREPAFVLLGVLQKPHGIRGEIGMRIATDFPERLRVGRTVYLGDERLPRKIVGIRHKADLFLLLFEGISQREEVAALTNQEVFASVRELPSLPEGRYYHHQLIGLEVWEKNTLLGELMEILSTGANDVYVVRETNGKELLLPAIPQVILETDLKRGRINVALIEGLRT